MNWILNNSRAANSLATFTLLLGDVHGLLVYLLALVVGWVDEEVIGGLASGQGFHHRELLSNEDTLLVRQGLEALEGAQFLGGVTVVQFLHLN